MTENSASQLYFIYNRQDLMNIMLSTFFLFIYSFIEQRGNKEDKGGKGKGLEDRAVQKILHNWEILIYMFNKN